MQAARERWPEAFVIGAAKSATTSLHRYLGQHPDVFALPAKDTRFFAFDGPGPPLNGPGDDDFAREFVTDRDAYLALFAPAGDAAVRIESSVVYLDLPHVADRILARRPDARFLAILRDPAERAWSQWLANVQHRKEPLGFEEALAAEAERIAAGWSWLFHYRARGRYHSLLSAWLERVPADPPCVLLPDRPLARPRATL